MIKPWLAVPPCLVFLLLNGCVSTSHMSAKKAQDPLQRRIQTWLGTSRDYLEKYWGVSKNTKDMGMGLRYLTYRSKGKPNTICSVVFTVDISNTVKGGEWSGHRPSCLRFVKGVPSLANPQNLVSNEPRFNPER